MFTYLIQGITLGFSAGVSPGPFQAYLFSRSLTYGWKRTIPTAIAPLLSDGPIIILVLFILTKTPLWMLDLIKIFGGLYIIYLGCKGFITISKVDKQNSIPLSSSQLSLYEAAIMNFLNPNPYIFWSSILGPLLIESWRVSPIWGIGFLLGF